MNQTRMQQLIDMLDEVEAGTWRPSGPLADTIEEYDLDIQFSMSEWGEPDDPDEVGIAACGFSACAVGHMLCDARFQDQGFQDVDQHPDTTLPVIEGFSPRYGSEGGYRAAANFFDITESNAEWLFNPDCYSMDNCITPAMVAYRVRDLLEETNS